MLDNFDCAFCVGRGAKIFSGSTATCLQSIGQSAPHDSDNVLAMEVATIVRALRQHLGGTYDRALHCPRAASSAEVASTYHHWFKPFSKHRRYCQLFASGGRMQHFLLFRIGFDRLPIAVGGFVGGQYVTRANKVCTHCDGVAVADELHIISDYPLSSHLCSGMLL